MKSRLIQLSKGNIEYKVPKVVFGVSELQGILLPDRKTLYEVNVTSENNVPMHLFFYAQNPRIRVSQPLQIGRSGKFTVEISTYGLSVGDRLQGRIDIVYNGGETSLPYHFLMGVSYLDQARKSYMTLHEFAESARQNPREAAQLFAWRDFADMPFMNDLHMQGLYHTYMTGTGEDNGLREFLKAAGEPLPERERSEGSRLVRKKEKDPAAGIYMRDQERKIRVQRLIARYEILKNRGRNPKPIDFDQEFAGLIADYPADTDTYLAYAFYLTMEGRFDEARTELLKIQDAVQKDRLAKKDHYCLFMWLVSVIQGDENHKAQCRELTHRFFIEGARSGLMFDLEYRLNPEISENHEKAAPLLLQYYTIASRDPMVFLETCLLWEKDTSAVSVLTEYELRCTLFGLRNNLISEKTLFRVLSHELKNPKLLNLYMLILKLAYKKYRNQEFLQAICNVYLQKRNVGPRYFRWYRDAVNLNLAMPGLYEHYMASLPKDFSEKLPMNLVLYFGYGRESSSVPLDLLYSNILTYYADDEKVMDIYQEKIDAYADRKLRSEEYSESSIPVLQSVLRKDHLNAENAQGVMSLLRLQKIETGLQGIRRVVIHYPQLRQEVSYAINEGSALAPVYSNQAIIAFEDRTGSRHYDPECRISPVFEDPELISECASLLPDRLLLQLREADEIRPETLREKDLFLVTSLIKNRKIDAFYRAKLYEALTELSMGPGMQHVNCCEFLLEADYRSLRPDYRKKLLQALIDRGYYEEAFTRIIDNGYEHLDDDHLQLVTEEMMDVPLFRGNPAVTAICWQLFRNRHAGTKIYDELSSYFEGSTRDMLQLLRKLRQKHQPTKDLVVKTFTKCMYVDNNRDLDALYDWYMAENSQEPLLESAYLVLRSHMYFMGERNLTDAAVDGLKKKVHNLPKVAMLALLKWFAEESSLMSDQDRALAEELTKAAASENIVLSCFSKLEKKIKMPVELEGRVYVEYRDPEAMDVAVIGQIFPGRHYFHRMLHRIYPGVFVRSFILYKREWIQYYYSVHQKDGSSVEREGDVVAQESDPGHRNSRYSDVARLEQKIRKNDTRETAELLRAQLLKEAMIENIFSDKE